MTNASSLIPLESASEWKVWLLYIFHSLCHLLTRLVEENLTKEEEFCPPMDNNASVTDGAAQSGEGVAQHFLTSFNSPSPHFHECLAVEKEKSVSTLAPTAALSCSLLNVTGECWEQEHVCVKERTSVGREELEKAAKQFKEGKGMCV